MPDLIAQLLPSSVGVGFKPQYVNDILSGLHPVRWLEIHAENYLGEGGRPISKLQYLRAKLPNSVHAIGLLIGDEAPLDMEHLAWSTRTENFLNHLLSLP